ncbi:hypothetical protein BSL78_02446 [Apostichopus japonicus]|uniref:Reverse transcriptase domain-containing protein n=1 Tax=Stichopus japonicus TaxID=307972 RepID=A0A2G8LK64_STIJA|nr:hypothetical protein BSL78_02446 [Apostichopus japonicus]
MHNRLNTSGDKYPHTDHPCPAQGKTCLFCKKRNHFAKVCKTKLKQQAEVNLVEQTTQHLTLTTISPSSVHSMPIPWVSPIRVVPKPKQPGKIRICVDMRAVKKFAIARERHVTPTIDDILAKLNGATVFTKLDLNSGYRQIELDKASRYLTVFSTHVGLYQYKRLNFGVNSGAEQFQNLIQSALAGLQGVIIGICQESTRTQRAASEVHAMSKREEPYSQWR